MSSKIKKAKDAFNQLDINNLDVVDDFYDKKAVFQDPIHKIKGVSAIRNYYKGLYSKVDSIIFKFNHASESNGVVTLEWTMLLKTPVLNFGKQISLDGVSIIKFGGKEGKVVFHRDYFDLGEFVYERIPVLSTIIKVIKSKMKGRKVD
jgi:hypothetical protein